MPHRTPYISNASLTRCPKFAQLLLFFHRHDTMQVTLQASKENVDEFFRVMDYSEKGMVRVKGILE